MNWYTAFLTGFCQAFRDAWFPIQFVRRLITARRHSFAWPVGIAIAACLALYLLAQCAFGFPICRDTHTRLTMIESPAPWLTCAAIAAEHGAHVEAFLMLASPTPACAVWSAGRGWIVAVPGVSDWVVGHELRHVADALFRHVPGLPIDLACGADRR